ncbi:hypothetical protein Rs2_18663 [Raphanus sativus]|nr:hypothetical protein Rs2_18663 [Raphanus sativus]
MALDSKNARLQVSIDVDKPLQFNRRIGFPNGDIGKVSFEYEGLSRSCFACNRISHDVYSCEEISKEERDIFIKELRENNAMANQQQTQLALPPNFRNNKRPRSPTSEGQKRSPSRYHQAGAYRSEKRIKESENYWTAKRHEGYPHREKELLNREKEAPERRNLRKDDKNISIWNRLEKMNIDDDGRDQRISNRTGPNHSSLGSYMRQDTNRGGTYIKGEVTPGATTRESPQSRHDSQLTVSELPTRRNHNPGSENEPRSGVLIVHQNETSEDRLRRSKGKAIMTGNHQSTPTSAEKRLPTNSHHGRGGTLVIRNVPQTEYQTSRYSPHKAKEDDVLDVDKVMKLENIDDLELTKEDEAEIDRMVTEHNDFVMDETMMDNDDLLGDEPGLDEEKIEAISQLSPANAVYDDKESSPVRAQEDRFAATEE